MLQHTCSMRRTWRRRRASSFSSEQSSRIHRSAQTDPATSRLQVTDTSGQLAEPRSNTAHPRAELRVVQRRRVGLVLAVQRVQSQEGLDPDGLSGIVVVAEDHCVRPPVAGRRGGTQVRQLLQGESAQDLGDRCPSVGEGSARRLLPAPLDAGRNGARLRERLGRATRPSNELQRELSLSPTNFPSVIRTPRSRSSRRWTKARSPVDPPWGFGTPGGARGVHRAGTKVSWAR
jgi:hypothetical protein